MSLSRIKTLALTLLCLSAALSLSAQGDAMLTHYWAVPTYYNPAAAGDTDNIRLRGGMRMQWVGVERAPRTFVAAADSPFKFLDKRWGAGLVVQQESYGLFHNLTADAQIGYKHKALKGEFTIALQAGLYNQQFRGSEVYIPDDDDYHTATDNALPDRDVAGNALDLGVGVYYVHKRFKAGVSLLHANQPTVTFSDENGTQGSGELSDTGDGTAKKYKFTAPRTLYFNAEGNIPLRNTLIELLPSVLLRSDFNTTDVAATLRAKYNKMFSAGIGYRHKDAVSLMLGAELKGIFIGYSYDYHLSDMARASSGSHEIFAGYNLKLDFSEKNRNKHKSIRIM
ncbi:MAG: PorP/SprF family type IX secretion system membrane protein [Duncaniella sp.]|nr:PorP/SprF family type IX secretion system membrane protein [Duncaniella sp.]